MILLCIFLPTVVWVLLYTVAYCNIRAIHC